ncbi:hypothetical protein V8C44DRAFT_79541 [Trichoderma aethiopicum]
MAPARTAGRSVIGGAPLAVSRMMDPTQWLVSRSTNNMQLPPFECLPPRQQQPWTAQAPRRLEHHSHQAFIGNPLGSLSYGFRPYNTGHESKSALCTLCHSTKKDQSVTVCPSQRVWYGLPHYLCRKLCRALIVLPCSAAIRNQKGPLNDRLMESCIRHQPIRITFPNLFFLTGLPRGGCYSLTRTPVRWPSRLFATCTPLSKSPHRLLLTLCAHPSWRRAMTPLSDPHSDMRLFASLRGLGQGEEK